MSAPTKPVTPPQEDDWYTEFLKGLKRVADETAQSTARVAEETSRQVSGAGTWAALAPARKEMIHQIEGLKGTSPGEAAAFAKMLAGLVQKATGGDPAGAVSGFTALQKHVASAVARQKSGGLSDEAAAAASGLPAAEWQALAPARAALKKQITELKDWGSMKVLDLMRDLATAERAATAKPAEAVKAVQNLERRAATLHQGHVAWRALDTDFQAAQAQLAELETYGSPDLDALKKRMRSLTIAATREAHDTACRDLPTLKGAIATALQTAKDKVDCDNEYDQIVRTIDEAFQVPDLNPTLHDLIARFDTAYQANNDEYTKGNYAVAQGQLADLLAKAQAVIHAGSTAGAKARQGISTGQDALATEKLNAMSATDKRAVEDLITAAPTQPHKDNLRKAVASGHSAVEIGTFAARIADKDEQWLQDHLHITASSTGTGVQQQFKMSCQATMVQAVTAELDPIYALKLHDDNPDISQIDASDSIPLALEQKQMLESAPDEEINATHLASARARGGRGTQKTMTKLQAILNSAATNWEKNQLLEGIGDPADYSPADIKAWFLANVQGKGPTGGRAVHITDITTDIGEGRRGVDLLNKNKGTTGLKYETQLLDASTRAAGVDDIGRELAIGRPVPLSVGGTDGELAHYVLAVSVIDGSPKTFVIHDPGSGTTVLRSETQLKNNQLDLPSGWSHLNKYEKPSAA